MQVRDRGERMAVYQCCDMERAKLTDEYDVQPKEVVLNE